MSKVSILIPTHNRASTILSAVESALGQTHKDVEVIVYDDGSDDNDGLAWRKGKSYRVSPPTPSVLRGVKDKRLKVHYARENHGPAYSRNRLMEMATGKYIAWLDSDDVCNKWRIEMSVDAIEAFGRPYVRTGTTTFGVKSGNTWTLPPGILWRGGVCFASVLFRSDLPLTFDEGYRISREDMDWEARYATKYGRSVRIPLELYGIGRRSVGRLTDLSKDEKHQHESSLDKAKYERVLARCEKEMLKNGNTKRPLDVPWTFLSKWLAKLYDHHYKHQAKQEEEK